MKWLIALIFCASTSAFAQTAGIKDIPTDGDTTISITKGNKAAEPLFEITEGNADIAGEPEVMTKAARSSWKAECDSWKKEIKDLNKDNQVLAITCNQPTCSKNATSETVCTSQGTYKVKTKIR